MVVHPAPDRTVSGRVVSVNPKGVRLDTHDGWLNFSRFATDLVPPERGQLVTLTLDRQGFVRTVDVADAGASPICRSAPGATTAQRDRTITRLALVKAAAEFAAARPSLKSGDVVKIAASWERWVTREPGAGELVDAF